MFVKVLRRLFLSMSALLLVAQSANVAALDVFFCEQNPTIYSCVTPCASSGVTAAKNISTSGGCGVNESNSKENKDQVWAFLVNKFKGEGYSQQEAETAAAGVMGNWTQESGVNSHLTTQGMGCTDSPAYGIAQWCFGRIDALKSFAADHGADPTCLGTQLDYMWSEMKSNDFSGLIPLMKGVSPSEAAHIFDLGKNGVRGFESGADVDKREGYANDIYKEYTGKDASSVSSLGSTSGAGSGSGSSGAAASCAGGTNVNGGPIPSANCKAVQDAFKAAEGSGKITLEIPEIDDDVAKCSEQKLERCTGGARAQTVRGLVAIAQNSGVDTIRLWNINEKHGCDQFDHPAGLASDIKQANGVECTDSNPDACKKVFDYIIANADELGIKYVIWDGSYCTDKQASVKNVEVYCNGDHNNHIHVSFKDS